MAEHEDFIDYYALLSISFDSTIEIINKSYRKVALQKHPDRNPNDPNAGLFTLKF